MPDYERLMKCQDQGLIREPDYGSAILMATYGDGFYDRAIIGDVSGLLVYTLNWQGRHRDHPLIQPTTFNGLHVGLPVPAVQYLHEFVGRRMATGNDPFWFRDVNHPVRANRFDTLCALVPLKTKFVQDRDDHYRWSISLHFAQVRGAPAQTP